MFVDFDKVFHPTPAERADQVRVLLELHAKLAKEKNCITCRNCVRVTSLPGFVTGEEYECAVGLECDTVLDTIKNCPKYNKREINF